MTTNNNYILCRWRDALDNPPVGRRVPVLLTDDRISADRPYDIGDGFPRWNDRVVQWLDITAIPAVPREAVQAAVDRLVESSVPSDCECPTCDAIRAMCRELGVAPYEVQ
jgi:hypothetical protein